jgi:hypothetical protein
MTFDNLDDDQKACILLGRMLRIMSPDVDARLSTLCALLEGTIKELPPDAQADMATAVMGGLIDRFPCEADQGTCSCEQKTSLSARN